jgi:hypothetical protein
VEQLGDCSLGDRAGSSIPYLQDDVVRLIALSCVGIGGLQWCATCQAFRAVRPPLLTLVIDNNRDFNEYAADKNHAVYVCPGPLNGHRPTSDHMRWSNQPAVHVTRIGELACQEQIKSQRDTGGFVIHLQLRPPTAGRPSPVMPQIFAGTLERLSISNVGGLGGCWWDRNHGRWVSATAEVDFSQIFATMIFGSELSALRVLEILIHEESDRKRAAVVSTLVHLIRSTSTTLRTLAICSGSGFTINDVRQFLPHVGRHLHQLSLFVPGLCAVDGQWPNSGLVMQPMSVRMREEWDDPRLTFRMRREELEFYHVDECSFGALEDDEDSLDEENPELPDEFAADIEEEMQTDMLRTWVEGLCIELREPSRVLAHAPGWGIGARRECEAALPLAHWLE